MNKLLLFLSMCVLLTVSNGVPQIEAKRLSTQTKVRFTAKTSVNLGLDYSDDEVAVVLREALANATLSNNPLYNQYTAGIGHARLLKAIAKMYSALIKRRLDPQRNVIVTVGAAEALHSALESLTAAPRNEWIIIEPFWSKYLPLVTLAHGVPKFTNFKLNKTGDQITGNDWTLNRVELESLFNRKTRGIIFNNPHNPIGKVYSLEDMKFIVSLAEKWDVIIIADEVYEWITYDFLKLTRMATIPGAFKRTLTIGSASKSFNVAGWRIGWAYGPASLISRLAYVHGYFVNNAPTPQQIAIAYAFEDEYKNFGRPDSLIVSNLRNVTNKRDFMVQAFRNAGMIPVVPNGGYCMIVSWPHLEQYQEVVLQQTGADASEKLSNWMINNIGVLGFPMSHFYGKEHESLGNEYIRFCFQKKVETLRRAAKNLLSLRRLLDTGS